MGEPSLTPSPGLAHQQEGSGERHDVVFLMAGDSGTQAVLEGGHRHGPGYSRPPSPAGWSVNICMKAVLEIKRRQADASTAGKSVGEEMGIAMGGSSYGGVNPTQRIPLLKSSTLRIFFNNAWFWPCFASLK